MRYYSCKQIEKFSLTLNGHLADDGILTFCCEHYDGIPNMSFCETAKETVEKYKRFRQEVIQACLRLAEEKQVDGLLSGCFSCPQFQMKEFRTNDQIYDINLSMYPAPCQCKCIYCGLCRKSRFMKFDKKLHTELYERLFEVLELMEEDGLIAPEAHWKIASGEITIHPFKARLLELVKEQHVEFCTNCFLFDEDIATVLEENPNASINLSIDAGTSKTWKKVKGFDNFDTILNNLRKYKNRSRIGQITLKYIILSGINDRKKDFDGIIQIMRSLGVINLCISRDMNSKCKQKDLSSAKKLIRLLKQNDLDYELLLF